MMYSCALWGEAEGGVRGDLELGPTPGDLESAQRRKIHHILRAARVKPGHRILEFGSGWGGLAIEVSTLSTSYCIHYNLSPRLLVILDAKSIL
jgi:cyclopropane-fatty-acyl-phospholipid synthase